MEDSDIKASVEKSIKNVKENIADSEIIRAFYAQKAVDEKSQNKANEWWAKENEQARNIKINKEFLDFINKNYNK